MHNPFRILEESHYHTVNHLLPRHSPFLVIDAILEGSAPGMVFVDAEPEATLTIIWDRAHQLVICGDGMVPALIAPLRELMPGTIHELAQSQTTAARDFNIYTEPGHKEQVIKVYHDHPLMEQTWRYYTLRPGTHSLERPHSNNHGLQITRIEPLLLARHELNNSMEITNWIDETWMSQNHFLEQGFGYCIIQEDTIVSWLLADYRVGLECEVGIMTDERYRRRGLATALVQKAIEHGRQEGIEMIGWHCNATNVASSNLAEKMGFALEQTYSTLHGWYNPPDNLLVNGYYCLTQANEFEKAAGYYEEAFAMLAAGHASSIFDGGSGKWCYYMAGCAWSLANETVQAFRNLNLAIDSGWTDRGLLMRDERLSALRGDDRWSKLLARLP